MNTPPAGGDGIRRAAVPDGAADGDGHTHMCRSRLAHHALHDALFSPGGEATIATATSPRSQPPPSHPTISSVPFPPPLGSGGFEVCDEAIDRVLGDASAHSNPRVREAGVAFEAGEQLHRVRCALSGAAAVRRVHPSPSLLRRPVPQALPRLRHVPSDVNVHSGRGAAAPAGRHAARFAQRVARVA